VIINYQVSFFSGGGSTTGCVIMAFVGRKKQKQTQINTNKPHSLN